MTTQQVDAIVAMALDDLEAGHADLPTVVHLATSLAWQQGRDEAKHYQSAYVPVTYPTQRENGSSSPRSAAIPALPSALSVAADDSTDDNDHAARRPGRQGHAVTRT